MGKKLELAGLQFGLLTVLREDGKAKNGHYKWLCRCQCGRLTTVFSFNLKKGHTTSCGCLKGRHVHGHSFVGNRSLTYNSWHMMKQRCTNPNHGAYKWYGERGIQIWTQWNTFKNFLADMGVRPEGHTLSRIDHDKDYCPGNCEWALAGTH